MRSILFISAIWVLTLCHSSCGIKKDILDQIESSNNTQALPDSIIRKNKVGNTVKEIADYNELEEEIIGFGNVKSDQYKRFEILQNLATRNDLLQLLDHKNAIVRTYAFWALTNRNDPSTTYISSNSQDTTFISYQTGCMSFSMRIKDFYGMFVARQLRKFPIANHRVP